MSGTELLFTHMLLAFSTLFPAFLMKNIKTEYPNMWVGYRTRRSMKSKETWDFAQEYSANMILWSALVSLVVQIFSYLVFGGLTSILVTAAALTASILVAIILVEIQLKNRFDKQGKPKSGLGNQN